MAKKSTILVDMRREEHVKSLKELPDRDLCEMIRAHFESHPTMPGEKVLKDQVNQMLAQFDTPVHSMADMTEAQIAETQKILSEKQSLSNNGFVSAGQTPFDNDNIMTPEEKEDLARKYAQTRIRETSLKEGNYYLDFRHFDPTALKREQISLIDPPVEKNGGVIYVDRVNVELQKNDAGDVYVLAEQSDGGHRTIGTLPDSFLTNNPMNVSHCEAELQLTDFSNGNMKNLSARVVVDSDLMSGDVIDLDENLLSGLDQETGLTQ